MNLTTRSPEEFALPRTPRSPRLEAGPASQKFGTWGRYSLAALSVTLIVLLEVLFGRALPHDVLRLIIVIAVAINAALGGIGPGLLALLAGATGYASILTRESVVGQRPVEMGRFFAETIILVAIGAWLASARMNARRADVARALLEKQMVETEDQERRHIGHDLHDGLGQQLTGIALLSESLAHELAAQRQPQAAQAEKIAGLVSEAIGWTREVARGLSPMTLETDGLAVALQELAARAKNLFNISCKFDSDYRTLPVADADAIHVYRIVQEAMSNSVRHGKAKNVRIRAAIEDKTLTFTVFDDGSGLSAKTIAEPGLGLRIMQYRANLIGARLTVARADEQRGGTIVSCKLPIRVTAGSADDSIENTDHG